MQSRQKSCAPCAEAKRRCNPQTPKCPRCETRGLHCYYKNQPLQDISQTTVSRSTATTRASSRVSFRFDQRSARPSPGSLSSSTSSYDIDFNDTSLDQQQTMYLPITPQQFRQGLISPALTNELLPAVATVDRWAVKTSVHEVSQWPLQFTQTLRTPFIHPSSLDEDRPSNSGTCLQDTFSACATYVTRTPTNEHVALKVVERSAQRLIETIRNPQLLPLEDHVDALQALLLLHIIQLWDGDIRQRALAELRSETIESWALGLHERLSESNSSSPLSNSSNENGIVLGGKDGNEGIRGQSYTIWERWILEESARRTVVLTMLVQGTFEASKFGVCSYVPLLATLPFTKSDQMWMAENLQDWMDHSIRYGATVVYEHFTRPYKLAGPQGNIPPPPGQLAKLLLIPCLGAAYRKVLAMPPAEDAAVAA